MTTEREGKALDAAAPGEEGREAAGRSETAPREEGREATGRSETAPGGEGPEAAGTGIAQAVGEVDDDGAMLREVLAGLALEPKQISAKYHYDERGSELFEQITRLDEYYPTRTERALLETWMPVWVRELRPAALAELGAGNAEKSRIVLDAMVGSNSGEAYVPIDVSHDFLHETARKLRIEYPSLAVLPTVSDITGRLELPSDLPSPMWIAFLGSTLGNFDAEGARALLQRIRDELRPDDRFLLGVDLRPGEHKPVERIELAYNDAAGVTAEFSLNVLAVINHQIESDFDLSAFRHRSAYHVERGRIETYLESTKEQKVSFPGRRFVELAEGERIRTEISCKYDRATIDALFAGADLVVDRWVEDERGYYALVLGGRV